MNLGFFKLLKDKENNEEKRKKIVEKGKVLLKNMKKEKKIKNLI